MHRRNFARGGGLLVRKLVPRSVDGYHYAWGLDLIHNERVQTICTEIT